MRCYELRTSNNDEETKVIEYNEQLVTFLNGFIKKVQFIYHELFWAFDFYYFIAQVNAEPSAKVYLIVQISSSMKKRFDKMR